MDVSRRNRWLPDVRQFLVMAPLMAAIAAFAPTAQASEGSQCTLCGYMFEKSAKQISILKSDGKTDDASMSKAMKDACATTSGHAQQECDEIVSAHYKALANSMRKGRSKLETCQQIGLCQNF